MENAGSEMEWGSEKNRKRKKFFLLLAIFTVGLILRLYKIINDDFFLYDEGFYLGYNLHVLETIRQHFPHDLSDFFQAFYYHIRAALVTGKALWFFIVDARVFWGGVEQWFFPHLVSAVFGSLSLFLIFPFAKKISGSSLVGYLGTAIFAVLPSHVFYSRLALQEGMCTFFFLAGFYVYLFPKKFGKRTFLSSVFLGLAYFSNYRLIVLPLLVLMTEVYFSLSEKKRPDFRKWMWHTLGFLLLVFGFGAINDAQGTILTFAWIFHQSGLATEHFDLFNFFSYPAYLFYLEGILFGCFFFGNLYFLFKKDFRRAFPFVFSLFYMGLFSLTAEKGARYLCVILPFLAVSVGLFLETLLKGDFPKKQRIAVVVLVIFLICELIFKSIQLVNSHSDYKTAVKFLKAVDRHPRIASTQPWIQKLYLNTRDVVEAPKGFKVLVDYYQEGFKYLVVCPQAYISFTEDKEKFNPTLRPYLRFILAHVRPVKTFPHFNRALLERFVFEHNENLRQSLKFLWSHRVNYGVLRIYDIKTCVTAIRAEALRRDFLENLPDHTQKLQEGQEIDNVGQGH